MTHGKRHAYVHTLQLEPRGDSRLNTETYHVYNWPAHANGSPWHRTVIIEESSDGSCDVYLSSNCIDFKHVLIELRKMANTQPVAGDWQDPDAQ